MPYLKNTKKVYRLLFLFTLPKESTILVNWNVIIPLQLIFLLESTPTIFFPLKLFKKRIDFFPMDDQSMEYEFVEEVFL